MINKASLELRNYCNSIGRHPGLRASAKMNGTNESNGCKALTQDYIAGYITSLIPPARPVSILITMLACFSITGLLGNALVLYVYVKKRNKLSSTVFIIALAATDFVTSAVSMPYTMIMEGLNYQMSIDIVCKLYYFVITCTVPFSVFIMVAIAVDRYICICRPHSHILDTVRARNTIFALLLLAILIGVIPALSYGVYLDTDSIRNNLGHPGLRKEEAIKAMLFTDNANFTDLFLSVCPNCYNQSAVSSDPALSEQLLSVVYDLVNNVCNLEPPMNKTYIFTGQCLANQLIFSKEFTATYKNLYSSSFLVCFAIVFVLYILIYHSVIVRRLRRQAARNKTKLCLSHEVSLTENQSMLNESPDRTIVLNNLHNKERNEQQQFLQVNNGQKSSHLHPDSVNHSSSSNSLNRQNQQQQKPFQKQSTQSHNCLKDKYFLANIRTAMMLFVVTLAFIIAYLPSWLTAFKVIDFNVLVFYVYFSNHIVNPFIYAFMNPGFRRSLRALLCRETDRPV